MRLMTFTADANPNFSKLSLSLASTPEEIREVQHLRYKVFVEAMGLDALVNEEGLDKDIFDEHCDHLIVRDNRSLKVVGTYRVMGPQAARRLGRFYSEQEFDLVRLEHLRDRIAEAGRACIHPDYRSGGVIMMLWAGLAAFMRREKCDYLIGCASISLADGGHNARALYHALNASNLAPAEYRVTPHLPFPLGEPEHGTALHMPPLIKGYLRSGAWVCGEPAWDHDFHSADLFMLLPLAKLDDRYARHYLKETRVV
jgi:putative hemolysin